MSIHDDWCHWSANCGGRREPHECVVSGKFPVCQILSVIWCGFILASNTGPEQSGEGRQSIVMLSSRSPIPSNSPQAVLFQMPRTRRARIGAAWMLDPNMAEGTDGGQWQEVRMLLIEAICLLMISRNPVLASGILWSAGSLLKSTRSCGKTFHRWLRHAQKTHAI